MVTINHKIKDCESEIKKLSEFLSSKGYSQAATYLANAKDDLFTYLKFWMMTGIVTPRVTSKLERLMRELNRRIKKICFQLVRERSRNNDEINYQTDLFTKEMG